MRENNDNKFVVIEGNKEVTTKTFSQKVTSPIRKKLLDFSKEKAESKSSILDLFRN